MAEDVHHQEPQISSVQRQLTQYKRETLGPFGIVYLCFSIYVSKTLFFFFNRNGRNIVSFFPQKTHFLKQFFENRIKNNLTKHVIIVSV